MKCLRCLMSLTMILHRWTILLVHFPGNVSACNCRTKPNMVFKLHLVCSQLENSISQCLPFTGVMAKSTSFLFWWHVFFILAWTVIADNNRTIAVIGAFIECVCQPLCQMLLHTAFSSFSLWCSYNDGLAVRKKGSSLSQVPHFRFGAEMVSPCAVCILGLSPGRLLPHFHSAILL